MYSSTASVKLCEALHFTVQLYTVVKLYCQECDKLIPPPHVALLRAC